MIDLEFFPGWVRRSVTFTIDDGNVRYDEKFLRIVRNGGIKGTFNLCSHNLSAFDKKGYREFYDGYEIANHVKYHPGLMTRELEENLCDDDFNLASADPSKVYAYSENGRIVDGLYYVMEPRGWRLRATEKSYIQFIDESRTELEEVFGAGRVNGFVWPFHEQDSDVIKAHIADSGVYGARRTGALCGRDGYLMPQDRMAWTYTATDREISQTAEEYFTLPDNGKLRFFAIGVHSIDFENSDSWGKLEDFTNKFGHRDEMFFFGTNEEIFAQEDAIRAAYTEGGRLFNPSDVHLWAKVDGEKVTVPPKSSITL